MHQVDGLSSTEQAAAVAVASVVGARAVAHDVNGRQGAFDVELIYPDGAKAALEITSHAGDGIRQRDNILATDDNQWEAPGQWTWDIRVANPQMIPELRSRYRRIILAMEARGLRDSRSLNPLGVSPLSDDLNWVAQSSINFSCLSQDPTRERIVYVMPEGTGGSVDKQLSGLAGAVSIVLAEDNLQRHAEKLRRSDHAEKHLFVALYEGAIPFAQAAGLMRPAVDLPECLTPRLPDGITHLWFISTYSHTLVEIRDSQWNFHDLDALNSQPSTGDMDE